MAVTIPIAITRMIQQDGWYVVHIHSDKEHPCPNCETLGSGREPNSRCPVCLGLGFRVLIAPLLVRNSAAMHPGYDDIRETETGLLGEETAAYYSLPSSVITEGDYFVEVTWDVPKHLVLSRGNVMAAHKVYEANRVERKHAESGVFAYYRAAVHSKEVDKDWLCSQLRYRPQQ